MSDKSELFNRIEETVEGYEDDYENLQSLLTDLRKSRMMQESFDLFALQEHLKKGDFVATHIERDNFIESVFVADDIQAFILNYDSYGDYLDGSSIGITPTGGLKSFANVDLLPHSSRSVVITSNPTMWRDKAIGFLATIGIKTIVEGGVEQKWIVKLPSGNPKMYAKPSLKIYEPFNNEFPNDLIKKLKEMFDNQKV